MEEGPKRAEMLDASTFIHSYVQAGLAHQQYTSTANASESQDAILKQMVTAQMKLPTDEELIARSVKCVINMVETDEDVVKNRSGQLVAATLSLQKACQSVKLTWVSEIVPCQL